MSPVAHRILVATALAACLLLAGCTNTPEGQGQGPGGAPEGQVAGPGEGTFWMVWVHGRETHDPPPGYACDIALDHAVDPEAQALGYEESRYSFDPDSLAWVVAFDHFEAESGCPLAYTLHVNATAARERLGEGPMLALFVHANGTLQVSEGAWLPPGGNATFTYHGETVRDGEQVAVEGTYTVEHLGPWPTEALEPME